MEKFVKKIEAGDFEIIESGSFILPDKRDKIKLYIDDIIIEIVFDNDPQKTENYKTTLKTIDEHTLVISCENFQESPFGAGFKKPELLLLDDEDNKEIYFKFMIFNLNHLPYIFYTFYKKIKDNPENGSSAT